MKSLFGMSNFKYKPIFIILIVGISVYCVYLFGRGFAPGSYPYSETYHFDYPEHEVIQAAEKVKLENIYLSVGKGWEDNDTTDYWHHIYFNFHNKLLLTWTRPNGNNQTTFAIVRIQENSEWKDLNRDLSRSQNEKLKEQLEKEIVGKIRKELALKK